MPVYQLFEKPADIIPAYANHAHNDAVELWLETGVFGLALIAVFVVWLVRNAIKAWRAPAAGSENDLDRGLVRAATVILALLLVHSLVDYPLRSAALAAIAAFACALLVPHETSAAGPAFTAGPRQKNKETRLPDSDWRQPGPRHGSDSDGGQAIDPPRRRERWGEAVEWPEQWRKPPDK